MLLFIYRKLGGGPMEESFIIENSAIEFLLLKGNSKKKDGKVWYALAIKIKDVQQILCWLSAGQYNTLLTSNK